MSWTSTSVKQTTTDWTVSVQSNTGEAAELSYPTEAQARYFAAVLELGPASLPKQAIIRKLGKLQSH